uniref:Putative polyol transporter 6 n=1 Tax=Aegilops tauschii TaxID=37682 RepID=M8BWD1_AEGTA
MGVEEQGKKNGGDGGGTTNKYAVACSVIGSIISILMGYDTGVMSGAMLFIKEDLGTNDTQHSPHGHGAPWAVVLAITTVFTFVASFSIGVGPITWAYSSEVWPLRLRAQGASIGVAINRIMNAGVSMTFVTLYKAITIGGAFFLFAGLAVVAATFFYFCCPETQGRPLEEIEEVFSQGWGARRRQQPSSLPVADSKA